MIRLLRWSALAFAYLDLYKEQQPVVGKPVGL